MRSRRAGRSGVAGFRTRRPAAHRKRCPARRTRCPFSWDAWLALGLGVFRLAPAAFWSLSLAEWRALLAARRPRATPLTRAGLDALMQRYPD
ncbi:MAG: phage tail assembly chaperone [Alphaproteobacteria bacterium]|nr:phage tail assembly chaperone [Alphaproteobacteria bacterium]